MKIAFLIQDLFQQGAQYVTALMVRGFVAKGYDVDLILSKVHQDLLEKGDIKPFEIPESVNIINLPDRKARNNIKAIRKYLKTSIPDAIVSMSSNYNVALALAVFGISGKVHKKCNVAYVEHLGGFAFDTKTMRSWRPRLFSKGWFLSKLLSSSYDTIMGVSTGISSSVAYWLRKKPGDVHTVYNPVIDDIYWQKLYSEPINPWIRNKTVPTFIAAGAHSSIKNHKCLFEAVLIANLTTPVRLILYGQGALTADYKEWIEKNGAANYINLAGHISNLPAEIKHSDGVIISSNIESFSVVLVEALAANIPVISTNCPSGPPELLQNGKYGTLVPVNDPVAMADAIVKQIINPRPAAPKESWLPYTLENVVMAYEKALGLF